MKKSHEAVKKAAPEKAVSAQPKQLVEASFVFVDSLKQPIEGLTVKIAEGADSHLSPVWEVSGNVPAQGALPITNIPSVLPPVTTAVPLSNSALATTDKDGHAVTISNVVRGKSIDIFVKKTNGSFQLKGTVKPNRDINAYTIVSPEYHFEATTRLSPKQELEEDLKIPVVKDGEIMTIERLLSEFGDFIGSAQKVTEVGKVLKDFPTKKKNVHPDPKTGKPVTEIEIEHHYKVVKTDKPRTVSINVLPSRLNYPTSTQFSEKQFTDLAASLGCELAAVKAVTLTEAGGRGFIENGLPGILFERHHFYSLTKPAKGTHPYAKFSDICNPVPGGYGGGGIYQYERLVKAARLDRDAALESCSWGAFQVLGEYYTQCGYKSAVDMVNDCMKTIDAHMKLFEAFLKAEKKAAIKALKNKDWEGFTSSYNGSNWQNQNPDYPGKMKDFYDQYK